MKRNLIFMAALISAFFCGGSLFAFAQPSSDSDIDKNIDKEGLASGKAAVNSEETAAEKPNGSISHKGRAVIAGGTLVCTPGGVFAFTQGTSRSRVTYTISPQESDKDAFAALSSYVGKPITVSGFEVSRTSPWNITIAITDVKEF